MNRRLQQFLAAENISQSQFADTLGVARASVSHILAGRNKPGFDFIESMSRHYPDINLEWIITGKGKMYKTVSPKPEKTEVPDDLFSSYDEEKLPVNTDNSLKTTLLPIEQKIYSRTSECKLDSALKHTEPTKDTAPANRPIIESYTSSKNTKNTNNQRNIVKIVVFYDDNTYQELK